MWCPYITKKSDSKKIMLVTTDFGALNVLMPIFLWKIGERLHFMGFIFHRINRANCFHSHNTTQWKAWKRFPCKNLYVYVNLNFSWLKTFANMMICCVNATNIIFIFLNVVGSSMDCLGNGQKHLARNVLYPTKLKEWRA
jgi:hypothetical protein